MNLVISSLDTIDGNLNKVKTLTTLAGQNRYIPATRKLIDKALDISSIIDEPRLKAHSYYSLGNYYYYNSKTDSCLSAMDKALKYVEQTEDPLLKSSILSTKGGAYTKLGAVILAISTSIESGNILEKIDTLQLTEDELKKYKGQQLVLNNSLANLYNSTEDFDTAIEYYDKAYDAAVKLGSLPNGAIILNNKGDLLIKINKLEEGLEVLKLSKEQKLDAGLPARYIARSDLNIGMATYAMGNYDDALKSYESALTVFEEGNNELGILQVLGERGILYNSYGRHEAAIMDCERSKQLALKIDDSEYLMKTCNCLYEANNALGNYETSLKNHEMYSRVKDSIFNEKNIRKITQVGMQYEFDKKEAEQQLIIEKKNRQKNQILVGLFALIVFAFMIFIFFKKRLKYTRTIAAKNKAIQQQKITQLQQENKLTAMSSMIEGQEAERLRIAKDLHDSLGGLLSTVKAHFGSIQKEKTDLCDIPLTDKTSKLIDEACIEVRRISHNMMPHALSISGLEGAIQDMTENLNEQSYDATFEANSVPKLESTREIMIYRLIQEIVSNIRKHANAKSILIQLLGLNNEVHLLIEDDGKGFNYEEAVQKNGLGLKSINSRVEFLNGRINWDSEVSKGTTININIPVS